MSARRSPELIAVAVGTLVAAVVGVLVLTRPKPVVATPPRPTEVVRERGDLAPVRDEENHFAPGSPPAVTERFLRLWWRAHYGDAATLATGTMRARCDRDLAETSNLPPEHRETLRQLQIIAEATEYDLERVMVTDLPPGEGGVARKEVRGVIHAHGVMADGALVESRREQTVVLHLLDGSWKVAEWTPSRGDAGVIRHPTRGN